MDKSLEIQKLLETIADRVIEDITNQLNERTLNADRIRNIIMTTEVSNEE